MDENQEPQEIVGEEWEPHREEVTRKLNELSKLLYKAAKDNTAPPTMSLLFSALHKVLPELIASDICNVQPMTGPTGEIFALSVKLEQQTPQLSFKYNIEPIVANSSKATRVILTPTGYDIVQARLPYN